MGEKYIYESPDNGKTVYRSPLGSPDERELVSPRESSFFIDIEGLLISWEE